MLRDFILKNRTYRRYHGDVKVDRATLEELVDLARLSSSGANMQSLKYFLSCEKETNDVIFQSVRWAGYLKDWSGPEEGERPNAYIIILSDKEISVNYFCDQGIAIQSILLGATEKGLGGCILGSLDKEAVSKAFNFGDRYEPLYALAIGKPKEVVVLEEVKDPKDIKYYRDENGVHHVPKRKLKDIIVN